MLNLLFLRKIQSKEIVKGKSIQLKVHSDISGHITCSIITMLQEKLLYDVGAVNG